MPDRFTEFREAALINALRACQLFSGVPLPELTDIARVTVAKQVARGDYLFHEGEPTAGFYILQSGAINVHRVNALGKEQVIHVFRAGESLAEAALAGETGYPADARAIEDSRVLMVQRAGFVDLLKRRPELALRMLGSMSAHLRVLVGQLEDMTLKNVETRLANWLVKRLPDPDATTPAKIELPGSKRVLAAELGTVSETLSRTLARFRKLDLLKVTGRVITVSSPAKLVELLQRNLGE